MAATLQDIASDLAPTGVLRASINLGNPVLAPGTASDPSGVTVARRSFDAMVAGDADICFLAVEPAREAEVAFTPAYVVIEGVFAVPAESPVQASADVDRPGVRIGVERGSAYDLYLTRTLQHAEIVRGEESTTVFLDEHLDVAAGIRQPLTAFVRDRTDLRLVDERFMEIRQAVGATRSRRPETVQFLGDTVEELKASAFVSTSLARSGQGDAVVAPPA